MSVTEIKVPNIGDYKDVEVIEVLVSEGQTLKKNDPLITIESDKSSVEIPSNFDGKIKTLKIKVSNEKINHIHKKNESAILQKVLITTNNYGQRNKEINNDILDGYERRFLIIGSSITLGWEWSNQIHFPLN